MLNFLVTSIFISENSNPLGTMDSAKKLNKFILHLLFAVGGRKYEATSVGDFKTLLLFLNCLVCNEPFFFLTLLTTDEYVGVKRMPLWPKEPRGTQLSAHLRPHLFNLLS